MRHTGSAFLLAATLFLPAGAAGAWTNPEAGPANGPPQLAGATSSLQTGPASAATTLSLDALFELIELDALAVDMYLKIDGIEGESTAGGGHEDWIEVLSFSWGETRPSSARSGRTRGGGRASFSDVSVAKRVDKASPYLYQACATGKHYPSATLTVRKAGEPLEYFTIRLERVMVSSASVSHSEGYPEPVEEVTLNYGKITWEYKPQDSAGADGSVSTSWDTQASRGG